MTFGDNNFIKRYENLNKKEQEEVWKEIKKRMEEEYEKYLQTLAEVKDIKLGKPHIFTKEDKNVFYKREVN